MEMQEAIAGFLWKYLDETALKSSEYKDLYRRYREVKGYGSYESFALGVVRCIMMGKTSSPEFLANSPPIAASYLLFDQDYKKRLLPCQCYWVERSLYEALLNSNLPEDCRFNRLQRCGTLMLPSGVLKTPDGDDVEWIYWHHFKKGEPNAVSMKRACDWDTLQIAFMTGEVGAVYYSRSNLEKFETKSKLPVREGNFWIEGDDDIEAEKQFMDAVNRLVCGLFLWLTIEPDSLETSPPPSCGQGFGKTTKKNKRSTPGVWQPNWIGRGYQLKSEVASSDAASGTHASPRSHWRRGHWRRQPIGEGRTERKLVWIEPMLING